MFPKPRPAKLDRDAKRRQRQTEDERENRKVRARSGGRCEVMTVLRFESGARLGCRCARRASQIHHQIGGWGSRARGESLRAERKQHVCAECHSDITGHVLQRVGGVTPHYLDVYERRG